jgi:hypothetical protein
MIAQGRSQNKTNKSIVEARAVVIFFRDGRQDASHA